MRRRNSGRAQERVEQERLELFLEKFTNLTTLSLPCCKELFKVLDVDFLKSKFDKLTKLILDAEYLREMKISEYSL